METTDEKTNIIKNKAESIRWKNHKEPLKIMVILMILGCVTIALFAARTLGWNMQHVDTFFSNFSIGFLIAGSAFAIGSFIGFVFAVPKQSKRTDELHLKGPIKSYLGNDNLIEISDWLTKIIVGVGLTQLTSIPGYINRIGKLTGIPLGGNETGTVAAGAILIYFFICGFMFVYLWTRIYFARILENAGLEEGENKLQEARNQLLEIESDIKSQKEKLDAINKKLDELKSK
ncbi:hypothetical protein [Fluviicola sp.]|uniref:hypothetical protein n=1 Tax=Fluviicola sp. TaxID=1917219 RepID=UPI003D2A153C